MSDAQERIGSILNNQFSGRTGGFRPCAIFNERLDFIRVLVRDCSVTSTRINELVSVLEDTHYQPGQASERYIGFTLKGVRRFCRERGIDTDGPVKITKILDAILKAFPERELELAIDGIARRFIDDTAVDMNTSNVVMLAKAA